jgi:hypothetical protein
MLPAHLDPYELASLEQERLTGTPLPADGWSKGWTAGNRAWAPLTNNVDVVNINIYWWKQD